MDTLRGTFGSDSSADRSWEDSEDDGAEPARTRELPPHAIGQDERRMQVRAYNHWAGLLGENMFPSIEDLDPGNLPDFGPHSVLLDFSFGIDNPAVRFLGEKLAAECNANGVVITRLSDVPPRSLLILRGAARYQWKWGCRIVGWVRLLRRRILRRCRWLRFLLRSPRCFTA